MKREKRVGLGYVFALAGAERGKLMAGMLLAVLSAALSLVPYVVVYRMLVLIFHGDVDFAQISGLALMALAAALLQAVLMSVGSVLSHRAAFNTMHALKVKVLEHVSAFQLGFFQKNAAGKIKSLLFDDIERIEDFLAHSTLELAQAAIVPPLVFVFMLYLHWMMALFLLIPLVCGMLFPMLVMRKYPQMTEQFTQEVASLNASANEFIGAMPIIRMCHLTAEKFEQYRAALRRYTDIWDKMSKVASYSVSLTVVLLDSSLLFSLPFGAWLLFTGSLSAEGFLLFLILTMYFYASFANLTTIAMQSMELGSGLENIKRVMDEKAMTGGVQRLPEKACYGIDFDNVSFRYKKDGDAVLDSVNLHLRPGSFNALVGASGAGKSTLAQLIGRYWDVDAGEIKIGGVSVRDLATDHLMDLIAFVFQDVFLLEDTLRENIAMGADVDLDAVRRAARAAQIDDFIMSLPAAYETRVGAGGVRLSGGEAQRIAIARAILKDAPIVVFDEATSYADIENEHKIQLALQSLLRGKTTLMIAHRLHTVRNADQIIVFEHGKVVESGSHAQLTAKDTLYRQMWQQYIEESSSYKEQSC